MSVCLINIFAIPLLLTVGHQLYTHACPGTRWRKFLEVVIPRIVLMSTDDDDLSRDSALRPSQFRNADKHAHSYFHVNRVVVNLITQLAVMITFGAMFPLWLQRWFCLFLQLCT